MAVQQVLQPYGSTASPFLGNIMDPNVPTYLEAWELKKLKDPNSDEKPTYENVTKRPLFHEQETLEDMVKEQKKKGKGVQEDLSRLRSDYQRKQIKLLINEKQALEPNQMAEWSIVSVKDVRKPLDSWNAQTMSVATIVILKRQRVGKSKERSKSKSSSTSRDGISARQMSAPTPGIVVNANQGLRHLSAPASSFPGSNPNPFQQGAHFPMNGAGQSYGPPQIHQTIPYQLQTRPQTLPQGQRLITNGNSPTQQMLNNQGQLFGQIPGLRGNSNIAPPPPPPPLNTAQLHRPSSFMQQQQQQPPQMQFPSQLQGNNNHPQMRPSIHQAHLPSSQPHFHQQNNHNSYSAVYSDSDSSSYNDSPVSPRGRRAFSGASGGGGSSSFAHQHHGSHNSNSNSYDDYTPPSTPGSSQYGPRGRRSGSWGRDRDGGRDGDRGDRDGPAYVHVREHQKPGYGSGGSGYPGERGIAQPFRSVGGGLGRRGSGRAGSLEEGMRGLGLGGGGGGGGRQGGAYNGF